MALPKRLRVGYIDYKVSELPTTETIEGDHDRGAQTIRVRTKGRTRPWVANTLLHEVLHGLFYHAGLHELPQMTFQKEEMVVNGLTNGLSQFMRDNPHVARMIVKLATSK